MTSVTIDGNGPVIITECHECGWAASTGEPMCEHARYAQEAEDEKFEKAAHRRQRRQLRTSRGTRHTDSNT